MISSSRNQSPGQQCKSFNWFLVDVILVLETVIVFFKKKKIIDVILLQKRCIKMQNFQKILFTRTKSYSFVWKKIPIAVISL